MQAYQPAYVQALSREIELVAAASPARLAVHTVFMGGGTPSLLEADELERILSTLREYFNVSAEAEVTLEANPGTLTIDKLKAMRGLGVNRLSMGMQSAHPDDLRLLEREHYFSDVIASVKWARQAGFENLSLDLMFGLPGQDLERWKSTLELALGLDTDHLSLYALTLEHGTPFQHWTGRGLIPSADPDLAADMYDWAVERLEQAEFAQYEISNWAKKNGDSRTCKHNLQYWRNLPYLGFGAGGHGYAGGMRTANVPGIRPYIQHCLEGTTRNFPLSPGTANSVIIDRDDEIEETMMTGLRLTHEGISQSRFMDRFGETLLDVFGKEIRNLINQDLLEWSGEQGDSLRLTRRGRLLGNQVFLRFIGKRSKPHSTITRVP
jgi:oxygen-independent coproporphyrinogen-3 oxidase